MSEPIKKNKKEATREKNQQLILTAAEKLFSQLGYDGASMSMIAQEAEVPKANVLYYFKNKDNLYEAVFDRIIVTWNLGLKDISVDDDPAEVLYNYIKSKVTLAISQSMQSRLFATEIIRGAPYLQGYMRKNTRPWMREKCQILQAWMDAGKMDQIDPSHLLFSIWANSQYYADFQAEVLLLLNKLEYEDSDIEGITHSIAQITLKGVGLSIPDNPNENSD
ncbi:TetR/AcrR family transcriptional regulator [Colwellia echini]|uniref:DUF1956 domain-containing protein n=1 Tax=Colwellia echini TaxID=1982103 RepID=A0ABY3MZH0_9GAMM|nr:TetR/AcrR family transcriptional regulator [Colwellia echini]TYK66630.1 DUF1956 domain-containing protein [Colwellia echini]